MSFADDRSNLILDSNDAKYSVFDPLSCQKLLALYGDDVILHKCLVFLYNLRRECDPWLSLLLSRAKT